MTKMVLMNFVVAFLLSTSYVHAFVRHRRDKGCTQKGLTCTGETCCGSAICPEGVCCLPLNVNGCASDDDCCYDLVCNLALSLCVEDIEDPVEDPRPCGIHGETCTVDQSGISCCGDVKYLCEFVSDLEGLRCCIPVGGKGCSYTYHCCGSLNGNYCDPIESRCVYPDGTYPDDASGTTSCSNVLGDCDEEFPCCGDTRLLCVDNKCCIMDGISGCDSDTKCCSGICDLVISTCLAAAP